MKWILLILVFIIAWLVGFIIGLLCTRSDYFARDRHKWLKETESKVDKVLELIKSKK